jgi:uncharacterized protein (TIGR00369 family)
MARPFANVPVLAMTVTDIPQGFERQTRRSPLTDPWEPIYSKQTPEAIVLGLRLATPHTNARGLVHGGLIAALTDKAMGHSCGHKMRGAHSLVTVSLSIDFISSARIGQWLTVETDVIKTGSTICFAQCFVKADGIAVARASGTFRVMPKKDAVVTATFGSDASPTTPQDFKKRPSAEMPVADFGDEIDEGAHLG